MMPAILGLTPALDRRRSIAIKSGSAAQVVPNPATKPTISDRCNVGTRRLLASRTASSPQPQSASVLSQKTHRISREHPRFLTLLPSFLVVPTFQRLGRQSDLGNSRLMRMLATGRTFLCPT